MPDQDLTARVNAAQSLLSTPAAEQAQTLERAFAECSRASAIAMARIDPASGASVREVAGGLAIGLKGPVTTADLDAMEGHLLPNGPGAVQLEVCPFVDPSLMSLLAARGYRVQEWQLAWACAVPEAPLAPSQLPDPALRVRRVRAGEEELFFRAVMAGFLESEEIPEEAIALMRPTAHAERHELFLAFLNDEPIGGGSLAWSEGIAFVNGSGVRPGFRRKGAQGALLRARFDRARELGCTVAYSTTFPGTASRRNMERHGFSVAYPKLVMGR